MRSLFAGASLLALGACGNPTQNAADMQMATAAGNAAAASSSMVRKIVGGAQLYCGIATQLGPLTVALISAQDPAHAPIAVTTKLAVDMACAAAGGIAVVPPASGVAPVRAIVVPPNSEIAVVAPAGT